jgi:hypothetical protein
MSLCDHSYTMTLVVILLNFLFPSWVQSPTMLLGIIIRRLLQEKDPKIACLLLINNTAVHYTST